MNTQSLITDPAKLAVLVNPERIRSSVKRLFRNNISESLSEIFQNSQRAGAKNVAIVITPDGFSIQDDGHGILDGIEGFHTLLKLAESSFDNPTIEDQDPMGIGIASLLTHDQIEEVSFASGDLRLAIDPTRWWSDRSYYSTWFERIETLDEPIAGFLIYVRCKPELIAELKTALEPKERNIFRGTNIFEIMSPAQGYEGVLSITLDSNPVVTSLPRWATFREVAIETTYQGCRLLIGYNTDNHYHSSCVRWYGQLIEVKQTFGNFNFYLDVDQGRPVNPLSPTRSGIINDTAFKSLIKFVINEIFRLVCDPANRAKIQSGHVDSLHRIDDARALSQCPYITARELLPMNLPDSFEEAQRVKAEPAVFSYDDAPLLINDGVIVLLKKTVVTNEYGHHSFISMIAGGAYELQRGDRNRLKIADIYWKPGRRTKKPWFHQPGEFGLSYTPDQPPTEWQPITNTTVMAFTETGTTYVDDVDLTVGTSDPIAFLHNEVWATFLPSDEFSDYETQRDQFAESVEVLIRELIGNCVPRNFAFRDLEAFIKPDKEAVTQVTYRYPRGTFKKDGTLNTIANPNGITLQTSAGRKINLKFY